MIIKYRGRDQRTGEQTVFLELPRGFAIKTKADAKLFLESVKAPFEIDGLLRFDEKYIIRIGFKVFIDYDGSETYKARKVINAWLKEWEL